LEKKRGKKREKLLLEKLKLENFQRVRLPEVLPSRKCEQSRKPQKLLLENLDLGYRCA
jgi:hypothetical protein